MGSADVGSYDFLGVTDVTQKHRGLCAVSRDQTAHTGLPARRRVALKLHTVYQLKD